MNTYIKKPLHLMTTEQLRELADIGKDYNETDMAIAWQLFDRLMENRLFDKRDAFPLKQPI